VIARRGPLVARRFVLFLAVLLLAASARHLGQGAGWADSLVVGFDLAVIAFAASLWPLSRDHCAADMRRHSAENDANRGLVLVMTVVVSGVLMLAMAAELPQARSGDALAVAKLICTLALGWLFTNLIFMLHYAHMFYGPGQGSGGIAGGFEFPGTAEPDYWDFLYFAFTAGMSFAASDVDVTGKEVRKVLVLHSLLSFAFNIGALAFCINVLAGSAG
jgi:uncharacterized membrane protein